MQACVDANYSLLGFLGDARFNIYVCGTLNRYFSNLPWCGLDHFASEPFH